MSKENQFAALPDIGAMLAMIIAMMSAHKNLSGKNFIVFILLQDVKRNKPLEIQDFITFIIIVQATKDRPDYF